MGEVYRARDLRLGRDVAVKVLPADVATSPERLARLEREARTVARLNHPGIVTLFSIEDAGGVRFLTMELVEGETLLDRVGAKLALPDLLDIAIPLTDALIAAHASGVVHRDLKPGNVMITRDGRVKVLDFGLAKVATTEAASGTANTRTVLPAVSVEGQVVGTAPYMAPEQLRGEPADPRTDLFALGVLLYELATGRRPFEGPTPASVASSILRDTPRPMASLRPDVPRSLEPIVSRCLQKSPADRPQSASEVRAQLVALHGAAVPRSHESPSIAVLPFTNMSADPENEFFSDGLSEELLNVLTKIPELKVTGRTSSFAFKGKQEDLRDIGHKLGVSTLLEGSVRKAGNRIRITAQLVKVSDGFHIWSETYDRVLDDIFAVQDDIARAVSAALHVKLLGRSSAPSRATAAGYELLLRANHFFNQNTASAMERAAALYREATERSPEDAAAWAGLAKTHAFQAGFGYADNNEARALARKEAERAISLDELLSDAHAVKGLLLGFLEFRWDEAILEMGRAMELAPGASEPMVTMSQYLGITGKPDEALQLARRAQDLDPLNPSVLGNRGRAEAWVGNLEAARDTYLRTLELSPGRTAIHGTLGVIYIRLGLVEQGLAELRKESAEGYRDYFSSIAYLMVGDREQSDAAFARLRERGEDWSYQFASIHAMRGEVDEAFRWLDRAYELRDPGLAFITYHDAMQSLHSDPRWPRFLERIGLGR
jgi:serine/threonine-protein kinase